MAAAPLADVAVAAAMALKAPHRAHGTDAPALATRTVFSLTLPHALHLHVFVVPAATTGMALMAAVAWE